MFHSGSTKDVVLGVQFAKPEMQSSDPIVKPIWMNAAGEEEPLPAFVFFASSLNQFFINTNSEDAVEGDYRIGILVFY